MPCFAFSGGWASVIPAAERSISVMSVLSWAQHLHCSYLIDDIVVEESGSRARSALASAYDVHEAAPLRILTRESSIATATLTLATRWWLTFSASHAFKHHNLACRAKNFVSLSTLSVHALSITCVWWMDGNLKRKILPLSNEQSRVCSSSSRKQEYLSMQVPCSSGCAERPQDQIALVGKVRTGKHGFPLLGCWVGDRKGSLNLRKCPADVVKCSVFTAQGAFAGGGIELWAHCAQ